LAIGALARAGAAFGERAWIDAAAAAADHVLRTNRDAEGALVRASLDGRASTAVATAADLGLLADGL
ncbi:thioredoxin domain-containing protein, partial [Microbacterium sp. H6]